MTPATITALEGSLLLKNRFVGIGWHPDVFRHFDAGGLEEAEARCAEANQDLLGFVRPPAVVPVNHVNHTRVSRILGPDSEAFSFDSPRPSGKTNNDRVHVRLYRPAGHPARHRRVVLFHHPVYQRWWGTWEWFLSDLIGRVPVATMAAPYHFERVPPGEFPGEGMCNPNPWRLFEAFRQWCWDQQATIRLLRDECDLEPVAAIGYSIGAHLSLLASSAGAVDWPIVSIASTNRYAHGVIHGSLGRGLVEGMRRAGIDEDLLWRMTDSVQLERYVHRLHDRPVLYIYGVHDRVDPPPSLERLEHALRPMRAIRLDAGHATVVLQRARVAREIREFLGELGILDRYDGDTIATTPA